jgi:hypothetical protein
MLQRLKLYDRFRKNRPAVLAELHAGLADEVDLKDAFLVPVSER